MRAVVQRVASAEVTWGTGAEGCRRSINKGLVVLLGADPGDDEAAARRLASKVAALRIFEDADGKTNLSLREVGGEALVVSQFTLYADVSRGRRPSFVGAAEPGLAAALCESFSAFLAGTGIPVREGAFGAHMTLTLSNDGPMTLVISTEAWPTRV